MKLLLATSAIGLAMAAVAPVTAEADTAPAEAPVWMASVMSLATDDGFALVQDEDEDCDDEDEEDEDNSDDEEDEEDEEDADDEDGDDEEDEDSEECEDDEEELV